MTTRLVVCGVVLAGCMISPVMQFGEGKSARQAQHDTMEGMSPAQLATTATWTGDVSTRRVRVWADDHYRAQNVKWQHAFDESLELANLVLTPVFGLKLVAEYRVWNRHEAGATLAADLAELQQLDPGDGVLAVVGLTSSLPLVSATFDDLGIANLGGSHLIVRGYADLEERKLYADAFRDLRDEERELALESRRHHKTAVILLHEIGHTLGADHDPDQDTIMHASYSHKASAFSAHARDVVLQTLDQRLGRGAVAATPATPAAPAAAPDRRPGQAAQPLVFHILVNGEVERNGKPVSPIEVDKLLLAAYELDHDTEVVLKKSREAPTRALSWILERCSHVGLKASVTLY